MLYLAFILGVLGSVHCVGMCGAIALVIPLHKSLWVKSLQVFFYFLGKTLTYALLGVVFALIGKGLYISHYQQQFSIFIGAIMLILGILSLLKISVRSLQNPIVWGLVQIKSSLGKLLRSKNVFSSFLIGFLNGFLPCGLVYMALFGALTSSGIISSVLYMVCFGLGTVPLMLATLILGNLLGAQLKKYAQKLVPFFIIIMGVIFMARGAGLGIKGLSPANTDLMIQQNPDCIAPSS